MDISLTGTDGLPPKAYISIRAGDTRRQAPATNKEVFRFPPGGYKCVVIDVFEKLASAQVSIAGLGGESEKHRVEQLSLTRIDGSKIGVGVKMEMHDATAPIKPKPKATHSEAAAKAKQYLEEHGVQKMLQDMVHALLAKQPADPLCFMSDFINGQKSKVVKPPAPKAVPPEPVPARRASASQAAEILLQGLGDEELAGFPVDACPEEMPDISSHFSLMAEVLKKDPSVYSSLKGVRTTRGVTFAKVIKPGMDNRGHRMIKTAGIFAGDAESYSTFGQLFEPILSLRYGGPPAGGRQPSDLDHLKVSPGPIDPAGRYVISVQARLSRNLATLRFPPACSLEERREAERVLAQAFLELSGELEGDYLPLAGSQSFLGRPGGMSEEEEADLECRGALFREPDSTIALSSGIGRHWPDARGVFSAHSGKLWAWLNEEDHVRLVSWQEGSDLRAAFARLCSAESVLQQQVQQAGHSFARGERFGFLTASPANAGTSLSSSASMRLPLLTKQPGFRSLCSQMKLQAHQSGIGVWTVSNAERFGSSEVQQVEAVILGCRELVDKERRLEFGDSAIPKQPAQQESEESSEAESEEEDLGDGNLADLPGLGDEEYPGFSAVECPDKMPDISTNFSLMADVLKKDPSVYDSLKGRRTKNGVPFAKVIKPGIDVKGHAMIKTVGVVAGDADSYEDFRELFDQVISLRHGGFGVGMRHRTDLDPIKVGASPVDPSGRHVLSVQLSAVRNLQGFRLPPACSFDERREVERVLSAALLELSGALQGDYHPLPGSKSYFPKPAGMAQEQEDFLRGARALFQEPDSAMLLASGMGRHWPDARGVFADEKAELAAWVNEEDHLKLFVKQPGANLAEAFARLCRAHSALEAALAQQGRAFMRSDRLGFISSCPSNLGSGLRASMTVKVPLLSSRKDFKEICKVLQLSVRGLGGTAWELSSVLGLGVSEAEIVDSVVSGCRTVVQMEEALARGEEVVCPGLGPALLPGFPADRCPLAMPNLWGHRNVLAQVLRENPSIYAALRGCRTTSGFSFAQAIKSGVDVRSCAVKAAPFGMVAGDAESYRAFALAFEPCVEAFHSAGVPVRQPMALDPAAVRGGALDASDGRVLSVCVRASRSLGGLRMPTACSFDERREVERVLVGALSELSGPLQGEYFPLASSRSYPAKPKGMLPTEQKRLQSQGLLFQEPKSPALLAAGVGRDWPDARGVFACEDSSFAAWINEEEHVTLLASRKDGDLKAAFACFCAAEKGLGLALQQEGYSFARCDRLGFLTAMPERLGTAMTVSVALRLPTLAARSDWPQLCADRGLKVLSVGRGGTIEVANQATLGVSEAGIVDAMLEACSKLLAADS